MSKRTVVTNSSDPDQVAKAEKSQKDFDRDLDYIVATPRGRRWVYELVFGKCHMHQPSHYPGDTHCTAFNEGARAVGEAILEDLRTRDFGKFILMLKENHGDE